ncbi:DUF5011 domain-containing protein [Flavobacterium rakeshii]|uniref:DUF5011 domain-containing protein n=1 Tax=Flavobacterium rakeshii TaxID=1038845 RepID=A0A6N8HAX1_9FLAO|nr:DUF5011 domain-containing protein [Flavobacterium rakeshii]MEE1896779.1 DUF5011 domain-containing protein [Flavobacterium rakeshii]MUV03694.1 DUF5011 domain-containing protein [Flavobacterium rakeshii]
MKILHKTIKAGLILSLAILASCGYEDPVGTTKVTYYPLLEMNGSSTEVLSVGDTYTEEGASATEAGQEIEVTTVGSEDVDTSTPGVYNVYYSAVNSDGFSTSQRRIVIVLSADPSAIDLEGTFFRNGNPNTVTRLDDRIYQCNNAGGLPLSDSKNLLNVTFYNLDDTHVYVPFQVDASESGIDVESNIGNIISEDSFNWVLTASAYYGTATRNFTR